MSGQEPQGRKFHYKVDGQQYEWPSASITGREIKARIPNFGQGYGLMQEGHGKDPDKPVTDDTSVALDHGEPHFYTVPPATFGK